MIRNVGIVLFDGVELLDVAGPAEVFSYFDPSVTLNYLTMEGRSVRSSQGLFMEANGALGEVSGCDILLVPGGMGTRELIKDEEFLETLQRCGDQSAIISSVCTGSALLAAAGLLDGFQATSNKKAFAWASQFGSDVRWEYQARWVHDDTRWTSSGVAAGLDMAVAMAECYCGSDVARRVLDHIEYEPSWDSSHDPFAV